MSKQKLIRITTVPLSLEKLLEGQLAFMSEFYHVIAVSSDEERLNLYGKKEGVPVFYVDLTRKITPLKDLKAVYKLYRFLKKEKPLIVHTHTPKAGTVGMLAARLAGVPLRLHTVAGLPLLETSGIKRTILNWVEKITYSLATHVYSNSKGLYNIIISEGFTSKNKLKVIGNGSSNGINLSYFDPSLFPKESNNIFKKELGIAETDFVYIFVGRVVSDKGITEMVEAFVRLQTEHPKCTLLILGPLEPNLDPLPRETTNLIESHTKIVSVGYKEDVRPYFACSDALVFPSYREGFPNVVLQANAMGLPAIVSNINGCNEIIIEDYNGIIVPVKDSASVYNAMKTIATEPELYDKLANNARNEIGEKYDRNAMYNALLTEYRALEV